MKPREQHNGIQMCPWHPNTWTQLGVLGKIFLDAQRGYNAFIKGRVNKRRQGKLNLSLASRETGQIHQVKKHGSQGLFSYLLSEQTGEKHKQEMGKGPSPIEKSHDVAQKSLSWEAIPSDISYISKFFYTSAPCQVEPWCHSATCWFYAVTV